MMKLSTARLAAASILASASMAVAIQGGLGTNHLPSKNVMPAIAFYVDATNGDDTQWAWHQRLNDPTRPYLTVEAVMDALEAMEVEMVTPAQALTGP